MSTPDPLDGFRDKTPQEIEAELRRRLGTDQYLVDLFQMGQVMAEWVETTPAGTLLYNTLNSRVRENLSVLIQCPTLDTQQARDAHANARAAFQALELIRGTVDMGREAERIITDTESTPL